MDEIQYVGEHLLPGMVGRLSIFVAFIGAILASFSYYQATVKVDLGESFVWKKMGRYAFWIQGFAMLVVISVIFYIMVNHYFEYQYVFAHVSDDLPFQYIFSAFWEGQEGSFLLWLFWNCILGLVLMYTSQAWESSTLAVLSLVQVVILSMVLGVYIGWGDEPFRLGSNPLLLLRDTMDAPIFNQSDYLRLIKGTGLNPLLQNYWMTIHPPTLFLGFASTVVPFCYAIAGFWTKKYQEWVRPVLPWALFSGSVLGLGILMGAAWAYEALTFGGYWAWDPVENMSLVPWILLIAGIHTNLIANATGYSLKATYFFYSSSFVMILYSTFLTRSGILGDSSVHAFTEMGLEIQLISFIAIFLLMALYLYFSRGRLLPKKPEEEPIYSREFWMFIGALVLFFGGLLISASTSLPVFNKIITYFKPDYIGVTISEPVQHFNTYQLWIGFFVAIFSGFAIFLRYMGSNWSQHRVIVFKKLAFHLLLSALGSFLLTYWIYGMKLNHFMLLFAGVFTLISNLDYLIFFIRGNLKFAASSLSHAGFGIMLIGILASGLNQRHISTNPFAQREILQEDMLSKNVLLYKDYPMYMSGYKVTYLDDSIVHNNRIYSILFEKLDSNGNPINKFEVNPTILYDNQRSKVAAYNPSTKHYWNRDIFTHIATIDAREADMKIRKEFEDTLTYKNINLSTIEKSQFIDTLQTKEGPKILSHQIEIIDVITEPDQVTYEKELGDIVAGLRLKVTPSSGDTSFNVMPMLVLRESELFTFPEQINELSMRIRLPSEAFDIIQPNETQLEYQNQIIKIGQTTTIVNQPLQIQLNKVVRNPQHIKYQSKKGDLAIGLEFYVLDANDVNIDTLTPIYLLRENRPFLLKDHSEKTGVHIKVLKINPQSETFEVSIASNNIDLKKIPLDVSNRSYRSDYIVLESIIFPGINFVWLGSILMMIGLGLGSFFRRNFIHE